MQLPKLTPLQSRLLASAIASSLVIVLWICFQPHNFVYAAEIPVPEFVQHSELEEPIPQALPNAPAIDVRGNILEGGIEGGAYEGGYVPDFEYFDRSLIGRQDEEVRNLTKDESKTVELSPNTTVFFIFEKGQKSKSTRSVVVDGLDELDEPSAENNSNGDAIREEASEGPDGELVKRQTLNRTVYISVNTCQQPAPSINLITSPPPQLSLHVSSTEQKPEKGKNNVASIDFIGGYANFTTNTTRDLYIGVSAPGLTDGWNGSWSFDLAASTDGYYHSYDNDSQYMYMIDTDSDSTLFVTYNLTSSNSSAAVSDWAEWINNFTMYAFPTGNWSDMTGLERSYCGLKNQFDTTNKIQVKSNITTQFGGEHPKALFNVQGLETNKTYTGFLAVGGNTQAMQLPLGLAKEDGEVTVRGGGQVFKQFSWTTKADDSCQVLFGLPFCSKVAYAVPSSTKFKTDDAGLIALYDTLASSYYENFTRSLDQIACETTSTAQYSLARNCTHCAEDYKAWLCSVVIPRCEDFTATDPWLQDRNIGMLFSNGSLPYAYNTTKEYNATRRDRLSYNQSRVPMIDEQIQPGPYKELLPCQDLCWDIVRSCPAQLGFACPNPPADQLTYGARDPDGKILMCNFPGAVVSLNQMRGGVEMVGVRTALVVTVAGLAILFGIM
ncbi:hypothetical protein P280DRAFT_399935 [Massarina eburnea CBS 473.64]|uniref:FZ domain-containing protein n=1 Tax=Massarina eburnea CBS 473.64 TaxID=1395130 RepID=A0A6A6S0X7_9PLEO|nr:hypothetical protein P280DRAFT_399935 [Massarina eburnea CBS 473.64]